MTIVLFWRRVFEIASQVSLLRQLRRIPRVERHIDGLTELYVAFGPVLAFVAIVLAPFAQRTVLVVGFFRVFEIVVFQVKVAVFDVSRIKGARRSLVLAAHNYVEVWFWFAAIYRVFADSFSSAHMTPATLVGSLYFSLITLGTVGFGDIVPLNRLASCLVVAEVAIGIFMVLVFMARIVTMMPTRARVNTGKRGRSGKSTL